MVLLMEKKNFKKKTILFSLISILTCGLFAALGSTKQASNIKSVEAAQEYTYPRNGQSGTIMLVSGGGCFNTDQYSLVLYCFNSTSDNAFSDKYDYRVSGDLIRAMIPYKNGTAKTWSQFIICRYDKNMNPFTDGWNGVRAQTADLSFSLFMNAQNTIYITGESGGTLSVGQTRYANYYYGISSNALGDNPSERNMYLDLSGFTDWENDGAKFALYFANASYNNESAWGQSNSSGGYYSSFCWKVEGQDNPHLYECIVPSCGAHVWGMVIAVRFGPNAQSPDWYDNKWNQTPDLKYDKDNQNANMVHVSDWNSGYLDAEHVISEESRYDFYGNYFLDTVACSGTGTSDATTADMWNAAKNEYVNHLSKTYQGKVWMTVADKSATASKIAQAMARYDYIVLFKEYKHEDFINRAESPNKTVYSNSIGYFDNNLSESNNRVIIVISILAASVLATTMLVVLKKKRK